MNPTGALLLLFGCWFLLMSVLFGARVYYDYRKSIGLHEAYDHFKRLNPPDVE